MTSPDPAPLEPAPIEPAPIDLSELLGLINAYVSILARADPEIYGRLVVWALQVLQADNQPLALLLSKLEKRPTAPRQWWLLRQYLTPAALGVLLRHLEANLLTFELTYGLPKKADPN
jgi:hypothetical protein